VLSVTQGWGLSGYLGVFGFSVLTNAILFLPSGRGVVMVAGAMVLNPLAVAVLTGIGGAIGELTGYALGRSTRKLVKNGKMPAWLNRVAARHMAITILVISIIPNPFVDAMGIVAGRFGYPVGRFLAYSMAGKVVQSIAFVYLALYNLSLLSSLTGIGQ
jgi:membrane protein YqaA with SNARE-associated domain